MPRKAPSAEFSSIVDEVLTEAKNNKELNRENLLRSRSIYDDDGKPRLGYLFKRMLGRYFFEGFCVIWSLNTLFALGIQHGLASYLAVMFIRQFVFYTEREEIQLGLWLEDYHTYEEEAESGEED